MSENKWVYAFGPDGCDGDASMRNLLGGKGANLAEMASIGLPVPPGFTITTEVCNHYYENKETYPQELKQQLLDSLKKIEKQTKLVFADASSPLLLSVRSGARASMPGMMDTVLNLGLNDDVVEGLAKSTGDTRFAFDSYRRFIQMYSDVVLEIDHDLFEDVLEDMKHKANVVEDTELTADNLKQLVSEYKNLVEHQSGRLFPQDPYEQIWGAIGAVFKSWMNQRAITYRRLNQIPVGWGTAVNVQAMVFGNLGQDCATGVAFTRNPSTGSKEFFGEYLINAQGEDVVAGIRTPFPLNKNSGNGNGQSMEEKMPDVYSQLDKVRKKLELHYKDMQDLEFTVQKKKLYMLQTRSGKRTAEASVSIAVDLANEGIISRKEAICRIEPESLDQLLHPTLDPNVPKQVLLRGLPASPGAASGEIVLDADSAEALANQGRKVILLRVETSPEDIHGMHAAAGILTARGGMTSHAAVVARGMGRPCVSGAGELRIDNDAGRVFMGSEELTKGDIITIDGITGQVFKGQVPTIKPQLSDAFATLMEWADAERRMVVRTNAETIDDSRVAREFGAEGIGLCRTEHMFFDSDRIVSMREMIIADTKEGRAAALAKLLPMQRGDFISLFKIMSGLPVTIRLLDPPLHEFLPHTDEELADVAAAAGVEIETARARALRLSESNPMLGHRGCRLAVTYPEICEMQTRAIIEAAIEVSKESVPPIPEIMIPLAATAKEIEICKEIIDRVASRVMEDKGQIINYLVGTMVELPRAALKADDLADSAEFFSFGTNDLTQTTLGISRDDAGSFLREYSDAEIYPIDPFVSIDVDGVGMLIEMATQKGRKIRPDIKLGICGEHGGDPKSISFCESIKLDYISCSPFRVPIARLAAAQATIKLNV